MKYTNITSVKWSNSEHTIIDCIVHLEGEQNQPFDFSAVAEGDYPYTHEIFARCVAGDFGPIAEYLPPPAPTTEELTAFARLKRNTLLAETDWTQVADVPQATKDLWAPYRQALRDIPAQTGFPENINWPLVPGLPVSVLFVDARN
jgi:hypothetical protein